MKKYTVLYQGPLSSAQHIKWGKLAVSGHVVYAPLAVL